MLEAIGEGRFRVMNTGRVSKLNPDGKTGLIQMDEGAEDVFFHRSALVGTVIAEISRGDRVVFAVQTSPRPDGLRYATHIRKEAGPVNERAASSTRARRTNANKPEA